jgi:hypothetical protein
LHRVMRITEAAAAGRHWHGSNTVYCIARHDADQQTRRARAHHLEGKQTDASARVCSLHHSFQVEPLQVCRSVAQEHAMRELRGAAQRALGVRALAAIRSRQDRHALVRAACIRRTSDGRGRQASAHHTDCSMAGTRSRMRRACIVRRVAIASAVLLLRRWQQPSCTVRVALRSSRRVLQECPARMLRARSPAGRSVTAQVICSMFCCAIMCCQRAANMPHRVLRHESSRSCMRTWQC